MCVQERVGHGTTDQQRIHAIEQSIDGVDLVRHFSASNNRDEWSIWLRGGLRQIGELLIHQQPSRRLRNEMRDPFGGCVRSMRCAKSVVYVDVAELRKLPRKRGIIGLFFGVEA